MQSQRLANATAAEQFIFIPRFSRNACSFVHSEAWPFTLRCGQASHVGGSMKCSSRSNFCAASWFSGVSRFCPEEASVQLHRVEPAEFASLFPRSQPEMCAALDCQNNSVAQHRPLLGSFGLGFLDFDNVLRFCAGAGSLQCCVCAVPLVGTRAPAPDSYQGSPAENVCELCLAQASSVISCVCRGHIEPPELQGWLLDSLGYGLLFLQGLAGWLRFLHPQCACCLAPLSLVHQCWPSPAAVPICGHCVRASQGPGLDRGIALLEPYVSGQPVHKVFALAGVVERVPTRPAQVRAEFAIPSGFSHAVEPEGVPPAACSSLASDVDEDRSSSPARIQGFHGSDQAAASLGSPSLQNTVHGAGGPVGLAVASVTASSRCDGAQNGSLSGSPTSLLSVSILQQGAEGLSSSLSLSSMCRATAVTSGPNRDMLSSSVLGDFQLSPPSQESLSVTALAEPSVAIHGPRHRCASEPETINTKIEEARYLNQVSSSSKDVAQPLHEQVLCGCGKGLTLASDPSFEVQAFVKACGRVITQGDDKEVQVGMHQVCNFCPQCILRWHATQRQVASRRKRHLVYNISGPRFFLDVCDEDSGRLNTRRGALDNDTQECCESEALVVSRANFDTVADDGAVSGVPGLRNCISRRTRRRRNRSARLDALIQPPRLLRGAPRTQEEEVVTGWRCKRQEEVGPLARGPGGPHHLDRSICRPNPCLSSLHGDPNPNLHAPFLVSNPGVRPDGCTRKIESSNSLCSPSLCLPSRKGSPNPNLAGFPQVDQKNGPESLCGLREVQEPGPVFRDRETNPHFGAQNGTLSGSPTCLLRASILPDVRPVGCTRLEPPTKAGEIDSQNQLTASVEAAKPLMPILSFAEHACSTSCSEAQLLALRCDAPASEANLIRGLHHLPLQRHSGFSLSGPGIASTFCLCCYQAGTLNNFKFLHLGDPRESALCATCATHVTSLGSLKYFSYSAVRRSWSTTSLLCRGRAALVVLGGALKCAVHVRPPDLRPTFCSRCWSEPACAFNRDHHLDAFVSACQTAQCACELKDLDELVHMFHDSCVHCIANLAHPAHSVTKPKLWGLAHRHPKVGPSTKLLTGPRGFKRARRGPTRATKSPPQSGFHDLGGVVAKSSPGAYPNASLASLEALLKINPCQDETQPNWAKVAALIEGAIVHGCSAFEPRFLELAEMIERQACENSLEWWLGSHLLSCAESSTSPAWAKPAALDLLSRQNGTAPTKVRIFSANITCWGPKIKDWVLTSIGSWDLLCIQETHLLKDIPNVEAALSSAALSHHFGPGQCSGKGGVLGGVLTVAPSHRNVRRVVEVMKEGCGFVGDELRLQGWSVVIFNVYLKSGSSLQGEINSEVLSQFLSLVNGFSVLWIAIGDFNIPAEEFASTSFPSEAKAELVSTQQPTTDHGATLDYALVSRELRGTTDISVCWDVPFKPHCCSYAWMVVATCPSHSCHASVLYLTCRFGPSCWIGSRSMCNGMTCVLMTLHLATLLPGQLLSAWLLTFQTARVLTSSSPVSP